MSWRVKLFIRKWTPIVLMAAVAWVGLTHWQRGGRANVTSIMTSTRVAAMRLPVLGSYFRGHRKSYKTYKRRGRSYAYGKRSGRRGHKATRRHRRGRR
jgi:hypothetical protein